MREHLRETRPPAVIPLTTVQCGYWFAELLRPDDPALRVRRAVRLRGPLDVAALREAWSGLVAREPDLRVRFVDPVDGVPMAAPAPGAPLDVVDLADLPAGQRPARWTAPPGGDPPLDLRAGPAVRAWLVRLSAQEHVLGLTAHRVAIDGPGLDLLLDLLSAGYAARCAGGPADAGPAATGRAPEDGWAGLPADEREQRLAYWAERLRAGGGPLELPTDRPRPTVRGEHTGRVTRRLPAGIADRLGRHGGDDLAPAVHAGLVALLVRYTGQQNAVVGTDLPADTGGPRWPADLADSVALRVQVLDDPDFAELTARVRQAVVEATRNRAPFLEVVRRLGGRRPSDRHPVYQVAFGTRRAGAGCSWTAGLTGEPVLDEPEPIAVDLRLELAVGAGEPLLCLDYAADLFDRPRMERLLDHLVVVLDAGAADAPPPLSRLPILRDRERELLMSDWQGPVIPYRREPVHEQIRQRARDHPGHVAAKLGERELTYGELDRLTDAVAAHLRARGVRPEEVVGVAMERGPDVLVAMVGILKAGCAFVMMDPTHPTRRLEFILEDTAARFLLTRERHLPGLPDDTVAARICLDRDWPLIEADHDGEPPADWAHHDSLAYVLYTSGSTGKPKGVMIEHGPLSNFLLWMGGLFNLGPGDRMLQHMALIFDFAEGEIFTALTVGATLVFVPEHLRTSGEALGAALTNERITYLGGPPAVLGQIDPEPHPDLRYIIVGGEAFTSELVNRWNRPGRRFINGYGPTEAAVGCIYYECEHRVWTHQPPIGRAMPNRYAYVVDSWHNLAPVGVPGEILVGGAGLARGYLNRPELTEDRFIADPFRPDGRVYRTGDLGVWTEDGQIQFLGRMDSQVKLNGLRIELEEIEAALASHPGVVQAAVALRTDLAGAKRLVGYVVVGDDRPTGEALRAHLARDLPGYMVPAQFVVVDGLPLSPVGKVDRAALPTPDGLGGDSAAFVPARTPVERQLAEIFAGVLGMSRISVLDDFFELGGDSLGLLRATARIDESFGVTVPVGAVYAAPTVADVAGLVEAGMAGAGRAGTAGDEPVQGQRWDATAGLLDEIESMTNEDVARLLRDDSA
jgi:amino acid adenylation domain-containing protein